MERNFREKKKESSQRFHLPFHKRIALKLRALKPFSFIKNNIIMLAFILPIGAVLVILPVVIGNMTESAEGLSVNKSETSVINKSEPFSKVSVSDAKIISDVVDSSTSSKDSSSKVISSEPREPLPTKELEPTVYMDIIEEKSKETILNTASYFTGRTTHLEEAMKKSKYYYETISLDPETKTSAYILAIDKNYAANLNGFFYYLIDETASTSMISPAILNLSILFDESNRKKCILEKTYAQEDLLESFDLSLKALLGDFYQGDISNFIYGEYKNLFQTRLARKKLPIYTKKVSYPGIDIIFRNSFMTYVEFFLSED